MKNVDIWENGIVKVGTLLTKCLINHNLAQNIKNKNNNKNNTSNNNNNDDNISIIEELTRAPNFLYKNKDIK